MPEIYDQKKLAIMNVARKIFARYGYNKTTLDDISEKVGMKKNSLYYYFPNKEALFNELIKIEAESILNELSALSDLNISQSNKIKKFLRKFIGISKERSIFHSITLKAFLEIHKIIEQSQEDLRNKIVLLLQNILAEGIRKKEFRKHNPKEIAGTVLNAASAVLQKEYFYSQAEFLYEIDITKTEEELLILTDLILDGLKCS